MEDNPEKQPRRHAPYLGKTRSEETRAQVAERKAAAWEVTPPDGVVIIIRNMKKFCREHGLTYPMMSAVAAGREKSHKGYTCKKIGPAPSDAIYCIY